MPWDGRMHKALTSILAVMLVASCLVAVASFMTPMTAQAAPAQPDGCPEECNELQRWDNACLWIGGQLQFCCETLIKYDCIDMACNPYYGWKCVNPLYPCPGCIPV